MTKIKICGLTRRDDIHMVNEARPDYIGFVFAESRRKISEAMARDLKMLLSPGIQAVGVFVNEDPYKIIRLCKEGIIDAIQLHGEEDESMLKKLRAEVPNPIIKAVRVRSAADIQRALNLSCDYLLLDTFKEGQYGGCGECFDWSVITLMPKPFFLAGGINSENVTKAIQLTKPYCIDVSSGVEVDGFKDANMTKTLIQKVRCIDGLT